VVKGGLGEKGRAKVPDGLPIRFIGGIGRRHISKSVLQIVNKKKEVLRVL